MGIYAFSALISALSFYLGALYLGRFSNHPSLKRRGVGLFLLLGGFFFFTFLRTVTGNQTVAYGSILSIYGHAILLPVLFFDFSSLYVSKYKVRSLLLPIAYGCALLLFVFLATGTLIARVTEHEYFSYHGVPGPAFKFYLIFITAFTSLSLYLLISPFLAHQDFRNKANVSLILSVALCIVAMFNTLLPSLGLPHIPALSCFGYLVPCVVLHALYRHGFLREQPNNNKTIGPIITILVTSCITIILALYVLNDMLLHSYTLLSPILISMTMVISGILLFVSSPLLYERIGHTFSIEQSIRSASPKAHHSHRQDSDVSTLLNIISHDIRGVVTSLSIGIQRLRTSEAVQERGQIRNRLLQLEEDTTCLRDMINGLESIFGMQGISYSSQWHKVGDVIYCVERSLLRQHPGESFILSRKDLPEIFAPPDITYHIFKNLIENSVKYSSKHSLNEIKIFYELNEEVMTLVVQDEGIGIRKRELRNVLKPFVRGTNLHDGHRQISGRGIGLAIVAKLSEEMGWTFRLASQIGKGTTASISMSSEHYRLCQEK